MYLESVENVGKYYYKQLITLENLQIKEMVKLDIDMIVENVKKSIEINITKLIMLKNH